MKGFDPAESFGPDVARRYDEGAVRGDEQDASRFLAEVAGPGRALEFAIGTGRIALPLTERGVEVAGIELSPDMVNRLRSKPGGSAIDVTPGDMSSVVVPGTFSLVYLVFNTIFNLLTQDDQVRCFENAARHLADDGAFVVEAAVPGAWTKEYEYVRPEQVAMDSVVFDICRYDPVTQLLEENHVRLSGEGIRFGPIVCRLIWPSEMDLMARIAGLRLAERWGGWNNEPFTADSTMHVSVYRRQ
ncbi:class I SAM-dependent DNA methyltransferase [Actinopolymorpha alba]|uniref:class I SAM-dependent DNA methyltransferase n=1 Tax=Actinopolymorpha alba TaxID=533267 RepID=UPI00037C09AA|nr:class I SAM-dependent methyltransferase [Actinopolymorpha alba]